MSHFRPFKLIKQALCFFLWFFSWLIFFLLFLAILPIFSYLCIVKHKGIIIWKTLTSSCLNISSPGWLRWVAPPSPASCRAAVVNSRPWASSPLPRSFHRVQYTTFWGNWAANRGPKTLAAIAAVIRCDRSITFAANAVCAPSVCHTASQWPFAGILSACRTMPVQLAVTHPRSPESPSFSLYSLM